MNRTTRISSRLLARINPLALLLILSLAAGPMLFAETPPVQVADLDQGTRLALVEDHRVPLVYLQIVFPAGTDSPWVRNNDADTAFRAGLYDPAGTLRAEADALGVRLSLWTSGEATTLQTSFLREDLEPALDLVHRVLTNDEFDRKELRRWRKSSSLGWKYTVKNPQFRLRQAQQLLLFRPGDPRRIAVERPARISTDTRELKQTRDTLIRLPGRIVGFSGDLTLDQAAEACKELLPPVLSQVPDGIDPAYLPSIPRSEQEDRVHVGIARLTQVYFALCRESLLEDDAETPALMIANHALGGYFFSRLSRALRHEGGETYGARSGGRGGLASQSYALSTFTRTDNADHTEEKLREVLRKFHNEGITEPERALAASALTGRRLRVTEQPARRLSEAIADLRHGKTPGSRDRLVRAAAETSLEQINQVIETFYDPSNFVLVRVEPR